MLLQEEEKAFVSCQQHHFVAQELDCKVKCSGYFKLWFRCSGRIETWSVTVTAPYKWLARIEAKCTDGKEISTPFFGYNDTLGANQPWMCTQYNTTVAPQRFYQTDSEGVFPFEWAPISQHSKSHASFWFGAGHYQSFAGQISAIDRTGNVQSW